MSQIVNAVTKLHLPEESLHAMTKRAVGHDFSSFSCEELAGGLCNAVYRIETEDRKMVLKVASPKDVVVMRHERNYVPIEAEMLDLLKKCRPALDEVTQPVYIHTDTWDGNLMIENGKLSGLIDYAAVLYGDPLMNHDFHDFCPQPNESFCRGFGKESFTPTEQIRLLVYRIWQRLGMIVERGFRHYEDPNTYAWVLDEYAKEVRVLRNALGE